MSSSVLPSLFQYFRFKKKREELNPSLVVMV